MRISRPCYDKAHRCPGWAGGGLKYPKVDKCDSGYITFKRDFSYSKILYLFNFEPYLNIRLTGFGRCSKCNVLVLPYQIRYIDPTWIKSEIYYKFSK